MGFATKDEESRKQTVKPKFASDYIKLTNEHQTIIRVLDKDPEISWQHYIPKGHTAFPHANAGKGMSFTCPGFETCPICAWNKEQKKKDPKTTNLLKQRKVYTFNVLDRTPVVICPQCGAEAYESKNSFPTKCSCGADLSKVEPQPRNKIQIMQKGQKIAQQFESFEKEPELGELFTYDIKLDTRGEKTETMTTCVPKQKAKLDMEKIVGVKDWQTKLYNIKEIVTPLPIEALKRILNGEDYYTVFGKPKAS